MITVEHKRDSRGMQYVTVKHPDFRLYGSSLYITGHAEPNYPMPAIPIEVEYFSMGVMVCEMNNPEYRLGLITLYPHG